MRYYFITISFLSWKKICKFSISIIYIVFFVVLILQVYRFLSTDVSSFEPLKLYTNIKKAIYKLLLQMSLKEVFAKIS